MKRLYVGGLSHSVTDKDLKDRFGKFGKVEDVELKTRTDEQGVPFKTFGYINITISDADLKKCLSVLNKSQWKGGTLQIETAKQSFLQRLSEEREEAVQHSLNPPKASSQQQLLDSMRDAGVSNFTMKSAVPGTEIPGHKDWVVAKFGRVLPVLQLNCRRGDKERTMKYDPSKYGHNLRVLVPPPGLEATPTPVSQLTWQVEGGDDDISRKRRGEFPPFTPPPKKRRDRPASDPIGRCNSSSRPIGSLRPPLDNESDEELRHIVQSSHDALGPEDDALEVVSTDFSHTRKKDDDERDSADTDELLSSRKPQTTQHKAAPDKKRKKRDAKPSNYDSTDEEAEEDFGKKKPRKVKKSAVKNVGLKRDKEADLKEESKEKTDETDSESDYEYAALFSHAPRLEISLSDLQALAERFAPEASSTTPRTLSEDDVCAARTPKRGTTPEEILASLLEGGSSEEEEEEEERGKKRKQKKKKRKSEAVVALPAFRGTKDLDDQSEQEKKTKMEEMLNGTSSKEDEASASEEESSSEEEPGAVAQRGPASSSDQDTDDEEEEEDDVSPPITDQEKAGHPPVANQRRCTAQEEAELQRRANERRLAAVLQRQKEAEQSRRLIQGALSATDGAPGGPGGKHIVFGSDDDDDKEEPKQTEPPSVRPNQPSSAPRLFDSDEDDGEEKDTERFEIRPEFEGQAGLKLMALQSRFGTDERFKMDARFLDDRDDAEKQTEKQTEEQAEEESLQTEKQKNLHILQSLLGTSAAPPERAKAKTFRDVSALHYDPSKLEHAAYEKKTEEQKESKGSRRKKREEAQKLPEVSKEIYFEVHADLKAVFGKDLEPQQNQDQEKELGRGSGWDQEDEEEEEEEEQAEEKETEETGGFKFSFFGDDPEPEPQQQTEYAAESIPAPKLSWQQDPRLNDSSDEEEEEGGDAEEAAGDAAVEDTPPTSELFFFFPSDRRLMDGAQWFCRTSLDERRDEWEETRTALRQDCKKKHKDARRKLRGSVQR